MIALALRSARHPVGPVLLTMIVIAWVPGDIKMFTTDTRFYVLFRELGRLLSKRADASDLVLVNSVPNGVIGVARYLPPGSGPERGAGMASWVEHLGVHRVPDDLRTLARGRRRILLVWIFEGGKSPPLEDWLRRHGRLIGEDHLEFEHYQVASILYFAPSDGSTFFERDQDGESGP